MTPFCEQFLHPLTSLLFPDCGGHCLDSYKAFAVKYDINEDLDLSYHYDNAEVTLNVSLGKEFTEGNLYFGDMRQVVPHSTAVVTISKGCSNSEGDVCVASLRCQFVRRSALR